MMHANSFSLARRLSARNEPDLLHESFADDGSPGYSKEFCKALVDKMCVDSSLPSECIQFPNIMSDVQRRNSDRSNQAIAFQGMSAREQAAAMSNRDKGQLHHAQVQRRLTTTRRSFKNWLSDSDSASTKLFTQPRFSMGCICVPYTDYMAKRMA